MQSAERRSYQSPVRQAQSQRTRERITDAARELFADGGFAATTIAAIARQAGVSQPTVYAVFGSKAGVLRAIMEQMELGADSTQWRERIGASSDPVEILHLWASWTTAFFSAARPAMGLAADLPEAAALAAESDRHRRAALVDLVARLATLGAPLADLRERVVDRAWTLTGLSIHQSLVGECGWSPEQYRVWLGDILCQQLLAPT